MFEIYVVAGGLIVIVAVKVPSTLSNADAEPSGKVVVSVAASTNVIL